MRALGHRNHWRRSDRYGRLSTVSKVNPQSSKLCLQVLREFRGIESAELKFQGHALLVGANNVGKEQFAKPSIFEVTLSCEFDSHTLRTKSHELLRLRLVALCSGFRLAAQNAAKPPQLPENPRKIPPEL